MKGEQDEITSSGDFMRTMLFPGRVIFGEKIREDELQEIFFGERLSESSDDEDREGSMLWKEFGRMRLPVVLLDFLSGSSRRWRYGRL